MHAKLNSGKVGRFFLILLVSTLLMAATPLDGTQPPGEPRPIDFGQTAGSYPKYLLDGNGIVYFSADDGSGGGQALWRSDGTEEGTFKLVDVFPSPEEFSSGEEIICLINVNSDIFFVVSSFGDPRYPDDQLWRTNGTVEGTEFIRNVQGFAGGASASDLLFFFLFEDANRGIWKSDGTPEGTTLVKAFTGGMSRMTSVNNLIFFCIEENGFRELWRSDGTESGTYLLSREDSNYSPFEYLINVQGTLFFQSEDGLSKSDGTLEGTVLVAPGLRIQDPKAVSSQLFFFANCALWKSDGTPEGTIQVKVLWDSELPGIPSEAAGGKLFFIFRGLWTSDGTPEGTLKIKEFELPPSPYGEQRMTAVNDSIFFPASEDGLGYELWKSDGTPEGTLLVKDIWPGSEASEPNWTVNSGGTLYFAANDGEHLPELWKSDGTPQGTQMVKDVNSRSNHVVRDVRASGQNLFIFLGTVRGEGRGTLWRSDAVASSPQFIADFNDSFGSTWQAGNSATFQEKFLFATIIYDVFGALELWLSDGTPEGTRLIQTIPTHLPYDYDLNLTPLDDRFFFFRPHNGITPTFLGEEFWVSDGTQAGTHIFLEIPNTDNPELSWLTKVNGMLFFVATDRVHGRELWKSDGTVEGTGVVSDIEPEGFSPTCLMGVGKTLFFTSRDRGTLWKSDGTQAGTQMVKQDIVPAEYSNDWYRCPMVSSGGKLYLSASSEAQGRELWRSDGTEEGTYSIKDIRPGAEGSSPANLTDAEGRTFFTADDGEHGRELWATDGSEGGAWLVQDIMSGESSSQPTSLTALYNLLFFTADDGVHGKELWVSDGTEQGTHLVSDLFSAENSSNPSSMSGTRDALFFAASDEDHTNGLWTLHIEFAPVAVDDQVDIAMNQPTILNPLNNDYDHNQDSLSVAQITLPTHGMVQIFSSIMFYTPSENFTGFDTFSYTITDGTGRQDTAQVTLRIGLRKKLYLPLVY